MKLQCDNLEDFEPVIQKLYNISFQTENTAKTIAFPSKSTYERSYIDDYNKAQNLIAKEVIKIFDLKEEKKAEIKSHSQAKKIDLTLKRELNEQIEVLENRILVLRRLFDSIAFKLFDCKIWIAKRFILQGKINAPDIPAIKYNLEAANLYNSNEHLDFAFISDLTTFVEVGDLIVRFNNSKKYKWLIIELKTGKVNISLCNLLDNENPIKPETIASLDLNTKKQLNRIIRQKERTSKIVELVKNNKGSDFRTNTPILIKDNKTDWRFYDKQLKETISLAQRKDIAMCVIENCFTILASKLSDRETFHFLYHKIYPNSECQLILNEEQANLELEKCRKLLRHPYVKDLTLHNMNARWRTPFFVLPIENVMLDLLFNRMRVVFYLDIKKFIALCISKGFKVEFHTKKETIIFKQKFPNTPLVDGKAIKITSTKGKSTTIGDGLFNRTFFDLVSPSSLIDILNETIENEEI